MCSSVVLTCITVVECSTDVLVLVLLYYSVVQRCTEARSTSRCIHVVDVLSSSTSVVDVLSSTRTYYMYYNCSTWRAPCTIPTSDCYLSHVSQPAMHHPYFFVPTLSGHSRKRPYFVQNPNPTPLRIKRRGSPVAQRGSYRCPGPNRHLAVAESVLGFSMILREFKRRY